MTNYGPFDSVPVTREGTAKIQALRDAFKSIESIAEAVGLCDTDYGRISPAGLPQFRERLEEAQMWGVKALSRLNAADDK